MSAGGSVRIADLPEGERPREKLWRYGPERLTDAELLAIVLRTGVKGCNVGQLAANFIAALGPRGLAQLRTYDREEFRAFVRQHRGELSGIGEDKIATLLATIEFGARVFSPRERGALPKPLLLASEMAGLFFTASTRFTREGFWAIFLDKARRPIGEGPDLITAGLLDQTLIDPATLFRRAILLGAGSVVVAHNHPSGDVTPSAQDLESTEALIRAGRTLGIPLRDHLILGRPDLSPAYLSLRVSGRCAF